MGYGKRVLFFLMVLSNSKSMVFITPLIHEKKNDKSEKEIIFDFGFLFSMCERAGESARARFSLRSIPSIHIIRFEYSSGGVD